MSAAETLLATTHSALIKLRPTARRILEAGRSYGQHNCRHHRTSTSCSTLPPPTRHTRHPRTRRSSQIASYHLHKTRYAIQCNRPPALRKSRPQRFKSYARAADTPATMKSSYTFCGPGAGQFELSEWPHGHPYPSILQRSLCLSLACLLA